MVESLQDKIRRALPELLRQDPDFRAEVLALTRQAYADREETESRFDRLLSELKRDREEQVRRWDEQRAERERDRLEQNRKWEEQGRKWEEQDRKWDEQMRENRALLEEIRQVRSRQDQALGAMGSRWGIASEQSFRDALKGILGQSFGVEVFNVNEFDETGMVFGVPDQVEIDVIIQNGDAILCELKSSMSKGDMYVFDRKVAFYQERHHRPVRRKLVISPMVRANARAVAERLGIEVFTYAEDARVLGGQDGSEDSA